MVDSKSVFQLPDFLKILLLDLYKIPSDGQVIFKSNYYNIIRKTWKGMNQTKMEGGTERHLPKTDDWCHRARR